MTTTSRPPPVLVVALQDGVRVYRATPDGWRTVSALDDHDVRCLTADRRPGPDGRPRDAEFRVGTASGAIWASSRHEDGWRREGAALDGPVFALELDAAGRLLAGTEPSAVHRRAAPDAGWEALAPLTDVPSSSEWSFPPRPDTHHVRRILSDPTRPGLLHVAVEAGALLRSPDDGVHWIDRVSGAPRDTHGLVGHRADPGRLYVAAGDGYFESRDHGDSWARPRIGLAHGYAWSVAVDRTDPELRLLTASTRARSAHDPGAASSVVYRRTGDRSWALAMNGLGAADGTTVGTLQADPLVRSCFWLATNRGVAVTTDGGESWLPVALDWPERFRHQRVRGIAVVR